MIKQQGELESKSKPNWLYFLKLKPNHIILTGLDTGYGYSKSASYLPLNLICTYTYI